VCVLCESEWDLIYSGSNPTETLFNQKFLSGGAIMNSCKSVSVKEKGGGLSLQKVCLMTKSYKTLPPPAGWCGERGFWCLNLLLIQLCVRQHTETFPFHATFELSRFVKPLLLELHDDWMDFQVSRRTLLFKRKKRIDAEAASRSILIAANNTGSHFLFSIFH
jgi:hypothetical protein